jgi:hypothetical protein
MSIVVTWGASTLHVSDRAPRKRFSIGEGATDCAVPREALAGLERIELLDAGALVLPAGATGTISVRGSDPIDVREHAGTFRDAATTDRVTLVDGAHVRVAIGEIVVEVTLAEREHLPRATRTMLFDRKTVILALSFAAQVGLVSGAAYAMPSSKNVEAPTLERETPVLSVKALDAEADDDFDEEDAEDCRCHMDEGRPGTRETRARKKRYGVSGPQDNPDPHLASMQIPAEQNEYDQFVGTIDQEVGDREAWTAPWGREDSFGNDPKSGRGRMWGDEVAHNFGDGAFFMHKPPKEPEPMPEEEEEEESASGQIVIRTVGLGSGVVSPEFHHGHGRITPVAPTVVAPTP